MKHVNLAAPKTNSVKGKKMKTYRFLSVFLMAFIISGCAPWLKNYGTIRMIPKSQNKVTIQNLIDTWENYNVYYSAVYDGYDPRQALGVMFDPKNNETKLVGNRWKKIKNKKDLIAATQWIHSNTRHDPWLNEILGPDGKFYGYLYYSYGSVTLKVVDDKTMYVFNLEDLRDGPEPKHSISQ
jgi:hypothetical protein